ncbi:hypothetical protein LOTGIDRAFT_194136 [Lottia gigantea]|uniref:Eukaryotic translation initiation factor 3 subunit K n=1 Tax=Lottia gigantea TaxID=225164 RepID=V3ZYI2_LOTGI|nr:hypothetical protein LOTGIDRAFT_194136 [Lottia gigantea]ESO87700.1 hypothetical protein LOTGIDRAFT_194136 [Lottia gigantea]
MAEAMRASVGQLLKGIDRYNPENLATLERYVEMQVRENTYDLEANLAILKLYQFNPSYFQTHITCFILLKALTNLPHTDFILCKCLIDTIHLEDEQIKRVMKVADNLEMCQFIELWKYVSIESDIITGIVGFEDSIRKFICHVVSATFQTVEKNYLQQLLGGVNDIQLSQWINKYGWSLQSNGVVFVNSQDDAVKTKNIREKITFDSVAAIMATSR